MNIRIRTAPRIFVDVMATRSECPQFSCFYYAMEHHTSAAGYSGCSAWTGTRLVCKRNERGGCPDEKVVADPARYKQIPWVENGWEEVQ